MVQLAQPAVRDIGSLPEDARAEILDGMVCLRQDPLPAPPLKRKLKGFGYPLHRLRIADYRILYRIDEKTVTIMRGITDMSSIIQTRRFCDTRRLCAFGTGEPKMAIYQQLMTAGPIILR